VVEREKLVAMLEELTLGSSELADESTRLKVGRMIGAREMVFGGYMVVGNTMRLDLRMVDVASGKVLKTAKMTAGSNDIAGWLKAARDAAAELLKTK
jgi:curli biogenesis system outer membrane secretion channel CsgG